MIDWRKAPNFSPDEFSENPDKYAEPDLIYSLQRTRSVLNRPVIPSPVNGALARTDGSIDSQHYIGSFKNPSRFSSALDWFCPDMSGHKVFWTLYGCCLWTAIGVYFGGRYGGSPCVRFHTDIRERSEDLPLVWYVDGSEEKYPFASTVAYRHFFNLLERERA